MVHARQQKILELLASKEGMTVGELSKLLEVTEATIRADLNTLSKQGKVSRVHGGAQLIEERVRQEYNFQTRKSLNSARKQKIGKLAAGLVNSYDSILLDSSTTSLALAHLLRRREDLREVTVVACGVWTAIELMGCQNINVLLTGGYLRHTSGSLTGLPASRFLEGLTIRKAFLGALGISPEKGLTDAHLLEVELKKSIISRVEEVTILVDGSKFKQTGLSAFAEINQVARVITDSSAPKSEIEKLRRAHVEVLVAT